VKALGEGGETNRPRVDDVDDDDDDDDDDDGSWAFHMTSGVNFFFRLCHHITVPLQTTFPTFSIFWQVPSEEHVLAFQVEDWRTSDDTSLVFFLLLKQRG
jgi:hypothetical protein